MDRRITELKNFLRERSHQGIALAFSGGVDSSFLLSVLCGKPVFFILFQDFQF